MIFLFKKNLFVNSLLLLPYTILLRSSTLLYPFNAPDYTCSNIVVDTVVGVFHKPWVEPIFTILLVFFHAVAINWLVIKNKLSKSITLLPGMLYILIMSACNAFLPLLPILFANTFFILALIQLFGLYKKINSAPTYLLAGFFIAMASIFYLPYVLALFLGLYLIYTLQSIGLVEILQFLGGFISVAFVTSSILYFNGNAQQFFTTELASNFSFPTVLFSASLVEYLIVGAIVLLLVIFAWNFSRFEKKKSLPAKKKISALFYWQLLSIISLFLICDLNLYHILFLSVSSCIFASFFIVDAKTTVWYELVHLVCVGLILNSQFNFYTFNF